MSVSSNSWVPRYISGKPFLLKYEFSKDSYRIFLSDFTAVYEEEVVCQQIMQKNMELNPNIEIEHDRLISIVQSCLESTVLKVENTNKGEIRLESYSTVGGIKFVWKFCTRLCKPNVLKDDLLSPLLGMIFELMKRQTQLIDCIKKKDTEIEDYKNNGAKVSRAYLETEQFVEQEFLSTRRVGKVDEQEIWKTVFSGSGQALLIAVTEATPPDKDHSKPEQKNVKTSREVSKDEEQDDINSQMELEKKRRQDIQNITSQTKTKKKKTFKL